MYRSGVWLAAVVVAVGLTSCAEQTFAEQRAEALEWVLERDAIVGEYFDGRLPELGDIVRPSGVGEDAFRMSVEADDYRDAGDGLFVRCAEFAWGGGGPDESQVVDVEVLAFEVTVRGGVIEQIEAVDTLGALPADGDEATGGSC